MQLFFHPDIEEQITLNTEESLHCARVLRKKPGDAIYLIDGKGGLYQGVLTSADAKRCEVSQVELQRSEPRSGKLHIAIAPTKSSDRLEWFVEKATEVGVDEFTFLKCQNNERSKVNLGRIEKKIVSASKQSQRLWFPQANQLMDVDLFINQSTELHKFIAWVNPATKPLTSLIPPAAEDRLIMIGPEGDFSQKEIQLAEKAGYETVSLGDNVLRTETAGLAAAVLLAIGPPTGR